MAISLETVDTIIDLTLEEIFGTGVLSIEQTTESSESGGINVITCTLTNGKVSTFNIKNGVDAELDDGSVTTSILADGAVTTDKIASGAVTFAKLGDDVIDSSLSSSSTHPLQNQAIYTALASKANSSDLATVAISGSYNDLSNKPTIPTVDSALSNSSTNPVQNKVINTALASKANSSSLATVATSGSYNDLSNKPTIPTVDSALSGSSTNPVQNKVINTALAGKIDNPSGGSTGQVLKKTASGVEWANESGGGGGSVTVDSTLSTSSTNPVQNKVITSALNDKADSSSLASVATSGSYSDLSNKPSLATVATSGSYSDLSNKPTIPTIDSSITQGGTNAVQGGAIYTELGNKADKFAKTTVSGTSVTQELAENTFYVFGEVSALTITLATPADANIVNEYHFRFTSGSTATTLSLPNSVNMPSGFQVEASKTYEISIVDNYGVYTAW